MILPALEEAASKGELILVQDGLCRWHLRKDGVVVIREILVLDFRRRTGLGKMIVGMVREKNPGASILARCPAQYPSNEFWKALGFTLLGYEKGINQWWLRA